ncbi:MAG: hypothetical protein IKK62_07925 [Bacteroidaceae bacterium]|nr:hypothetical protein [Bacteroidaceae bacterium]
MATLMLSSKKVFEHWNDKVAEGMKNECIADIQRSWNEYIDKINTRMNIYMRAEREIDDAIDHYERNRR